MNQLLELSRGFLQELVQLVEQIPGEDFRSISPEPGARLKALTEQGRSILARSWGAELSLGIGGEFSCGKATFTNAFLDYELFSEAAPGRWGTLPFLFRSGPECKMIAEKGSGERLEYHYRDKADLGALLREKSERAQGIARISCEGDFPTLPPGFSLIKLPSFATEAASSPQVRAMAANCDVLLALGHISRPLSLDFIEEIRKARGQEAENCIFIAAACDLLRESQLERMRIYFAERLRERFGAVQPFYFVSALAALDGELAKNNRIYDGQSFSAFRAELLARLASFRESLIMGSCLRQARTLMEEIRQLLEASRASLERDLEKELADWEAAYASNMARVSGKLEEIAWKAYAVLESELVKALGKTRHILQAKAAECEDLTALKNYAAREYSYYMEMFSRQFDSIICGMLNESLQKNIRRINFRYDIEADPYGERVGEGCIESMLLEGGELEKCQGRLAEAARCVMKKGELAEAGASVPFLSILKEGVKAFSASLLDRSSREDIERIKNIFQDNLENCFDSLKHRMKQAFHALYAELVDRQSARLRHYIMKRKSLEAARDKPGEAIRKNLALIRDYQRLLDEYGERGRILAHGWPKLGG